MKRLQAGNVAGSIGRAAFATRAFAPLTIRARKSTTPPRLERGNTFTLRHEYNNTLDPAVIAVSFFIFLNAGLLFCVEPGKIY
jgi:hypothetical protein